MKNITNPLNSDYLNTTFAYSSCENCTNKITLISKKNICSSKLCWLLIIHRYGCTVKMIPSFTDNEYYNPHFVSGTRILDFIIKRLSLYLVYYYTILTIKNKTI